MPSLKARIKITNKCENNCWYCSSDEQNLNEMSDETLDVILKKLKTIYINNFNRIKIALTGGDPFLNNNIIKITNKINNNFNKALIVSDVCISSNISVVKKFVDLGGFCLLSLNEHDLNEVVEKGLQIKRQQLYLFNVLLTEYNINRIDSIVDSVLKYNLPLRLNHLFTDVESNILLYNDCVDYVFKRLNRENYKFDKYSYPYGCLHINKNKTDSYCGYGKDYFYFDVYGNIRRCQMEKSIGNIYDNNLDIILCNIDIKEECKKCDIFYLCKGGCTYSNKNGLYCEQYKMACNEIKKWK